jgi:hypothetical protein
MKVRVIRKPEFTSLHHVQVKRWWCPFWETVTYDSRQRCEQVAQNLIEHGLKYKVLLEGESK